MKNSIEQQISGFGFLYAALRQGLDHRRLNPISHDFFFGDFELRTAVAMSSCSPLAIDRPRAAPRGSLLESEKSG